MRELEYPFDEQYIIKHKKSLKRKLLSKTENNFIEKRIAILGGYTTKNIRLVLELFLLNYGIKPEFYESEYNRYYEDGFFSNIELEAFKPDIIYICTSVRNISEWPMMADVKEEVESKRDRFLGKFIGLWDSIAQRYNCPIIQNNFEYPSFRLMGNKDSSDCHGRVNYVSMLNLDFYEYAQLHENLYICDVNYISASYGLDKWLDADSWYMYKYALDIHAIPYLAFNVSNIIKSLFGKNKKVFNLDLDNTLWGGVIGDDGADSIEIGQETAIGQAYSDFQEYIKLHKQLGIIITVNSKNEEATAKSGFERADSILKLEDFTVFKANWNTKIENLIDTAKELNVLPEGFVFVDDNPAERSIIMENCIETAVPEIDRVERLIQVIDRSGFFETTIISSDDLKRVRMYQENTNRMHFEASFNDYNDYLKSLRMIAEIKEFVPAYISRISQLTNKSNQFNLTTKRYSQQEIEEISRNQRYVTLYGRLEDRFGDNGVVSVIIGLIDGKMKDELHLQLWLMSCRVLKRDMEFAMMDELVNISRDRGIRRIYGYYYPTTKNAMVKEFYLNVGFDKIEENADGSTIWQFILTDDYQSKQDVIQIMN